MTRTSISTSLRRLLILLLWGFTLVHSRGSAFEFVTGPKSTIANGGDSVVLQCNTNVPATSVEWYFNGAAITSDSVKPVSTRNGQRRKRYGDDRNDALTEYSRNTGRRSRKNRASRRRGHDNRKRNLKRYVRSVDAKRYVDDGSLGVRLLEDRLEINNLEPKNAGSYFCISSIPKGSIRSSTALIQIARLSNFSLTEARRIKTGPRVAVIPCDIQPGSAPSPVIKWKMNGRLLEPANNEHYMILPSGDLLIKNATAEAGNEFRCLAVNTITSQQLPAPHPSTLQVEEYQGDPRLIFPHPDKTVNVTARTGERVLMACISEDLSRFTWTRDNGDIPDSAAITEVGLNVTVDRESVGQYSCKMEGDPTKVQYNLIMSDLTCDPTTVTHFNIKKHKTIEMGCSSNTSSKTWQWYHNGKRIADAEGSKFIASSSLESKGYYQCFMLGSYGACSVTFAVDDSDNDNVVYGTSEEYFDFKEDKNNTPPSIEVPDVPFSPTSHIIRWTLSNSDVKLISIRYYKRPQFSGERVIRYPHKVLNVPAERRSVSIDNLEPSSDYSIEMVAVSHEKTRSNIIISSFRTGEIDTPMKPQTNPEENRRAGFDGSSKGATIRPPYPPSKPRVNGMPGVHVALMWRSRGNGGSPIEGYKVQVKEGNGKWKLQGETKSYPYNVDGLERGKSYKFRIIAINAAGASEPSQASKPYPRSTKRSNKIALYDAKQGSNYITILWEWEGGRAPSDIKGYYIYHRPTDSDNEEDYIIEKYTGRVKLSFTIRNLRPATQYDVKVQAFTDTENTTMSNVRIVEVPPLVTTDPDDTSEVGADPNDPARAMSHQRNMIYLISGCIVAAITVILLFTVFCYWRKRGAQKEEITQQSKNGNGVRSSGAKKCDHMGMSKMNSNGQASPYEASSTQHSRNHSPHGTRCHCSRHHSNHSSLGRDGASYSSYPVSQVGYQHWGPSGNYPDMNPGPMHVIMHPRHYGIGRWVRGGDFCHIIPVDTRKMSHEGGQEVERQYISPGGLMVTRTYDGNLTTTTTETICRPDHGYHSNDDETRASSDSQQERSENANPSGDDDANSAGAATSGIVTLNEAAIDSRSASPANGDDEVGEQRNQIDNSVTSTSDCTNCEARDDEEGNNEATPFLNEDDKKTSVT